jgi:hypothetical protein
MGNGLSWAAAEMRFTISEIRERSDVSWQPGKAAAGRAAIKQLSRLHFAARINARQYRCGFSGGMPPLRRKA